MKLLLLLYYEFFKTGLFAVGGGLATIPFLSNMSDKYGWFTHQDLTNMIAVAESTPGPIGVNTATYVGYTTAGIWGGIIATLGLITPSIIIIMIISKMLYTFSENIFVKTTFKYLRPASIGLILASALAFTSSTLLQKPLSEGFFPNIPAAILAICLFCILQFIPIAKSLHPIVWICLSAIIGIIFF